MEVPPGRLEASAAGGREALISFLSEAERRGLNGLLAIHSVKEETPAEGVLVFNEGNGRLASHSWRETLDGPAAVVAILRDGLSHDASLELRSYDHRGNTVRVDQLVSAHPTARIDGLPDVTAILAEIESDEREERRRSFESMAGPDLNEVRSELRSVADGFASLTRQFHEVRARDSAADGAARHAAELELEKRRADVRAMSTEVEERRARLSVDARELEAQHASLVARAREVGETQSAIISERKQLQGLFDAVQIEMERVATARRDLGTAAEAVTARE